MINLLWPRDLTNPSFHGIRVAIWLIGIPLVVGAVYYVAAQHRRLGALPRDAWHRSAKTTPPCS